MVKNFQLKVIKTILKIAKYLSKRTAEEQESERNVRSILNRGKL